jgi:hypothetical protein
MPRTPLDVCRNGSDPSTPSFRLRTFAVWIAPLIAGAVLVRLALIAGGLA